MRCADVQATEPLWRRGELDDSDSRPLIRHIARCRSCRRASRSARAFDAALQAGLEEATAPVELRFRVRRTLATGPASTSRSWRAPLVLAVTVALLLLPHLGSATGGARLRVIEGWLVCRTCATGRLHGPAPPACAREGAEHRTGVQTGDGVVWGLTPGSEVLRLGLAAVRRGTRVRLSVRGAPEGEGDLVVESARLL